MMNDIYILSINFGSTSTKFAVYNREENIFVETVQHTAEEIAACHDILEQREMRENTIFDAIKHKGFDINKITAVVARGGLTPPLEGGTYIVEENMLAALTTERALKHATSLCTIVGYDIAKTIGVPCYTVDPSVTDEMEPVARLSGLEGVERIPTFHALNQKAMARRRAAELGKKYEELNFVVAHMGGGVTIGAHKHGRVIDVNNGLDGEGPFSPERTGSLPVCSVIDICFSGLTKKEVTDKFIKKGGMLSYIGTNDGRKAEEMALNGDEKAALVLDAMAYQVSKDIGAAAVVLKGQVDAIILTGGVAYSKYVTDRIKERVSWIADVSIYGGENEMLALTQGALRVILGEEKAKKFSI